MNWSKAIAALMEKHPKGKPLKSDGSELPDPVPMEPPIGYNPQPTMFEVIRKMIADEKTRLALEAEGLETPEEADDFDVQDDYDPQSPYEHNFDPPATPPDLASLQRMRDEIDLRIRDLGAPPSPNPPGTPIPANDTGKLVAPAADAAKVTPTQ